MPPSVDVVVPVLNEATIVGELVRRLETSCPGARLIFVDNASTDGTPEILERLPSVRLVRHAENLGYGRSLLDGIAASDGDYIVMIDADLEYLPEDIPAVLHALDEHPAVYGSRFRGPADQLAMSRFRVLGNRLVTSIFNVLFRQDLSDLYTGLRAVRRNLFPPRLTNPGFPIVVELACQLALAGHRIGEVPVRYVPRRAGRSKMRHVREFLKFGYWVVALRVGGRRTPG